MGRRGGAGSARSTPKVTLLAELRRLEVATSRLWPDVFWRFLLRTLSGPAKLMPRYPADDCRGVLIWCLPQFAEDLVDAGDEMAKAADIVQLVIFLGIF